MFKFWAPKYKNAKTEVFKNTQSYVQGKITYLSKLRFEYQQAEPGSALQKALRTELLGEAANVDPDKLPIDLQLFIREVEGGR